MKSSRDILSPKTSRVDGVRLDADWLRRPTLVRLIAVLSATGMPPRLVGGCVRDAVLERTVTDIDLASPAPPDAVMAALIKNDIKAVPTGLEHGTVTAVIDGTGYEITTLRRDVATDGRRAVVAFTDDWREDAARRDFTMNAMSAEPDGTVHDYFDGVADARDGIVRFVGEAARRIEEDYLRVLRYFRFQAWYGRRQPDDATLAALAAGVSRLDRLAAERVRAELIKWLGAPDPCPSWRLATNVGAAAWLFAGADGARLEQVVALEIAADLPADPLRRLAALTLEPGPGARTVAARFRLSAAEARYLTAVEAAMAAAAGVDSAAAARRLAYRRGLSVARDALLLTSSADGSRQGFFHELIAWAVPIFPIKGADAVRAGLSPGPAVGKALRAVEAWWIKADFAPDRAACLAKLETVLMVGRSQS